VTVEEQTPVMKELSLFLLSRGIYIPLPSPKVNIYWWPWIKNYYGELDVSYFGSGTIGARIWIDQDLKEEMGF